MENWSRIYEQIIADPRYAVNVQYGEPRPGHSEGTVAAHIADLERNLDKLVMRNLVDPKMYWRLKVLIHIHDTFKMEAKRDSPILDPQSHASLARVYLARLTKDHDMLHITQYHDIGYAVFKKMRETRHFWLLDTCKRCGVTEAMNERDPRPCMDERKLMTGLRGVQDMDLFLLFAIIDSCTPSKGREMIHWFVGAVNERFPLTTIRQEHVLE